MADVVREERDPLAGLAQRRDGVDRAVERLVADPEAAVEVEQHVVVAGESGGERHAAVIIIAAHAAAADAPARVPRPGRRRLRRDDEEQAAASPAATATATATPTPDARGHRRRAGRRLRARSARPSPRTRELAKPKQRLDPAKKYVATVTTNCGEFEITLDAKRAPKTGGSFKFLADKGFYDGLGFHRIVPGFVIQGGDPKGDGSGGPGYSIVEAPPEDLTYDKGVVAMAKTAIEDPGTSGQPVLRRHGEGTPLPPEYALLGKVTKGQEVVDLIGVAPVGPDEQPVEPIVIESVEVAES